jgi:septal ring factor EnvC (AmiA/AmiB activator)
MVQIQALKALDEYKVSLSDKDIEISQWKAKLSQTVSECEAKETQLKLLQSEILSHKSAKAKYIAEVTKREKALNGLQKENHEIKVELRSLKEKHRRDSAGLLLQIERLTKQVSNEAELKALLQQERTASSLELEKVRDVYSKQIESVEVELKALTDENTRLNSECKA